MEIELEVIRLTDDEGNEQDFVVLTQFELDNQSFVILTALEDAEDMMAEDDDTDGMVDLFALEVIREGEGAEPRYEEIEDEGLRNRVFDIADVILFQEPAEA